METLKKQSSDVHVNVLFRMKIKLILTLVVISLYHIYRNRKLDISTAPAKASSDKEDGIIESENWAMT